MTLPRARASNAASPLAVAGALAGALLASCGLDASGLRGASPGTGGAGAGDSGQSTGLLTVGSTADATSGSQTASSSAAAGGQGGAPATTATGGAASTTGGQGGAGGASCSPVDCGDASCHAVCPAHLDPGWAFVAYAEGQNLHCPAGWGSGRQFREAPVVPAGDCSCSCGSAPSDPCSTKAMLNVVLDRGPACNSAGIQTIGGPVLGGACSPLNHPVGGGPGVGNEFTNAAASVTPAMLPCPGTAALPALAPGVHGLACTPPPGSVSHVGCNGGPCVAAEGATVCVLRPAADKCPPGFATRHVVYDPAKQADKRTCGKCACTSSAGTCPSNGLTLFSDATCQSMVSSLVADGLCDTIAQNQNPYLDAFFTYSGAANDLACAPMGPAPKQGGAVELGDPTTICCP